MNLLLRLLITFFFRTVFFLLTFIVYAATMYCIEMPAWTVQFPVHDRLGTHGDGLLC